MRKTILFAFAIALLMSVAPSFAVTVQLQTAGAENLGDTWVNEGSVNQNNGADTTMSTTGTAGSQKFSMVKFNITSLPSGQNITNATYCMYLSANALGFPNAYNIMVSNLFVNYTCSAVPWAEGCPTWNLRPSAVQFNSTAESSMVVSYATALGTYCFDVMASVRASYGAGYGNTSLYVTANNSVGFPSSNVAWRTKEHATTSTRPYLNVTYFAIPAPSYSQNSTNSTGVGGLLVRHSLYWNDSNSLSGFIFSFSNGTGTYVNDSFSVMTGVANWSNVTKVVNSSYSTICWKVFANNSFGVWNVSPPYCYGVVAQFVSVDSLSIVPSLSPIYYGNYTFVANVSNNTPFSNVNISYTGLNADGGLCWHYYVNGTCQRSGLIDGVMSLQSPNSYSLSVEHNVIIPAIVYGFTDMFADSSRELSSVNNGSYQIFHAVNNLTINNGTFADIEFDVRNRTLTDSPVLVYLFGNNVTLSDFQSSDWASKGELVGIVSPEQPFNHLHGNNSGHYVIGALANSDGTMGMTHVNVTGGFYMAFYSLSDSSHGWDLSYRNNTLCQSSDWWTGNSTNGVALQSGCPDVRWYVVRTSLSNASDAVFVKSCVNRTLSACRDETFYFGALPELPPISNSVISPALGSSHFCPIVIEWNAFNDPNDDPVLYDLQLLYPNQTFIQNITGSVNGTSYFWDCESVAGGNYRINVIGRDASNLSSSSESGIFTKLDSFDTSLSVSYPAVIDAAGVYAIVARYSDNDSVPIADASVSFCYAFDSSSYCYPMTFNGTDYEFNFGYGMDMGGMLFSNVTASKLTYVPRTLLFDIPLFNTNITVRFWNDTNMTQPYFNEFLWVYAMPHCDWLASQTDYNGAVEWNACNGTIMHAPYSAGSALLHIWTPDTYDFYMVDGSVSWACDTCAPNVTKSTVWTKFDTIVVTVSSDLVRDYLWSTASSVGSFFNMPDMGFWLSVAGIIILFVTVVGVAYLTKSGIATIVAMILIYILLQLLGILGHIFWGII